MICIDVLELRIYASSHTDKTPLQEFGRRLNFTKGLNLVVGENTSGKSTLANSLFYGLGMEELIQGKPGNVSLDKAVKSEFTLKEDLWKVTSSKVFVQISNHKGETLTVARPILNEENTDRINVLTVWESSIDNICNSNGREYYVHNYDDHEIQFKEGFYALLAKFSDLPVVKVPSKNISKTKLYMQTIFASTFIEQKKGWSDFFSNIRSYNIRNPKQMLVEYIMNYKTTHQLADIEVQKEEKLRLEKLWNSLVLSLKNYSNYNGIDIVGLSDNIKKQNNDFTNIRLSVRKTQIDINDYLESLDKQKVLLTEETGNTDEHDDFKYSQLLENYNRHFKDYERFCLDYQNDKLKFTNISERLNTIEIEQRRYKSLSRVRNAISTLDVTVCPLCHQHLPLLAGNGNRIGLEEVKNNLLILKEQAAFLKPIKEKLEHSNKNKELYKLYLEKQLAEERALLDECKRISSKNAMSVDMNREIELLKIQTEYAQLQQVKGNIDLEISNLQSLWWKYVSTKEYIKELESQNKQNDYFDSKFLTLFRNLLHKFAYRSNSIQNIFFSEDDSNYKYLPIVLGNNTYYEEIRADSSASDFIRSLWAYYLSLLALGNYHPGFLIMDEPCQHSMEEDSLYQLFKQCSTMTNKQVILFCSTQLKTIADESKGNNLRSNVMEQLKQRLEREKHKFTYQIIQNKAVDYL